LWHTDRNGRQTGEDAIVIGRAHRSGNIGTSDALHRRIEVVKGFTFDNLGTDLRAYTERRETALDGDQSLVGEYLHTCDGNY
jgi:hypothetical protein